MRPKAVVTEAARNFASGTTRAPLYALALALVLLLVAGTDTRAVVDILRRADGYRSAGAAVQVLEAPGDIEAGRCEALSTIDGITAAGAVRAAGTFTLLVLPSTDLRLFEATPGLAAVLSVDKTRPDGVWLSADLTEELNAPPRMSLTTSLAEMAVAGTYPSPDDGRLPTLQHAVVAPVPATGTFDACWAEIWPPSPETNSLLRLALISKATSSNTTQITQRQLNSRLGQTYDSIGLFDGRLTRHAGSAAALAGLALGFASLRTRRLELASALHAGVPRVALTWQVLIETAGWAVIGSVLTLPVLWWLATAGMPVQETDIWFLGARTVLVGAVATLLGATLAIMSTHERHLFRYFRDR